MFLTLRNFLKKIIPTSTKNTLVRNLPRAEIFLSNSLRGIEKIWESEEAFIDIYKETSERSLLDIKKAYILYLCAKNSISISGDIAEFGVYKGAGSRIILDGSNGLKDIYLFDTFEGLPETHIEHDSNWKKGDLNDVNYNAIKKYLHEKNFKFYKGFFPDSTASVPSNIQFSFVHIDFDLYQSTLDALIYSYNKLSHGGIILIDDYGVLACQGVKKAADEFFRDKKQMVIPNLNGQCIIIKS